ncbi:MAG: AAA family ATPase [Candidatus Eremiobacteraeota bacterium]|nr:AAA family ATPase [Candidatus Eremiobacteraeota bacterium]
MKRFVTDRLIEWKKSARRKPLIIRGARQVGKSWAVMDFGQSYFPGRLHVIDLEKRPDWHEVFQGNLVASRVLSELEILLNAEIEAGKDLLFFDEIQSCPRALTMLRYFHEEIPELHVIAAGSLLEFALKDSSFPVGRVQFIDMYPLSFPEYLMATGNDKAAEVIRSEPEPLPESIHALLLNEMRNYLFIGGMPECVLSYAETRRLRNSFQIQADLISTYRQDFSKYAPHADKHCLDAVLFSIAKNVGRQIKYARLTDSYSIPTIKKAFSLLSLARVITKVPSALPSGLPLGASASEKRFKALMVDLGLMQHLCGLPIETEIRQADILDIYRGALAEQFVGQEFLAGGQESLHYWSREKSGSTAEVDYLIVRNGRIYPVEVKSGAPGKQRSLRLLLDTYPGCPSGLVLSSAAFQEKPSQKMNYLPLYYAYYLAKTNGTAGLGAP